MLIIITVMSGITSAQQKAKKEKVPFINVYFSPFSTFNLLFSAIERIKLLTAEPFPQLSG